MSLLKEKNFFKKHHRDEFFNRQPLNRWVYRYCDSFDETNGYKRIDPIFSIYEDYSYFGRSENRGDKIRKLNADLYLNSEHRRSFRDDGIDFLTKRKPFKERQIDSANLISKCTKNSSNVIHLRDFLY